jgi:hypothetical protein
VKVQQQYQLGTIPQQQTQLRVPLTSKGYHYLVIYLLYKEVGATLIPQEGITNNKGSAK